ncbi:hypothetical protein ABW636_05610, partial [Aquimarina sp. 2201CG1-2-11]|uniref:hypothetical protein n=1 Tax=Aquimarina discodermiae TaxID=3231043 RepID=UPI003476658B
MKRIISFVLLTLFCGYISFSQVKAGDNPFVLDKASLLELESKDKVFVVTRISTIEMNEITPLNGALVYNTDTNCLFQFRLNTWASLCNPDETITILIDNNDGTYSFTNEAGLTTQIQKSTFTDNGNDTFTFNNGDGNPITIDLNDADKDATNELNTAVDLDGTTLNVTDAGGDKGVDLDTTFATNAQLTASDAADLDKDATNELNTAVALDGTTLNVTDAGGDKGVDLDTTFATNAQLTASDAADLDKDATNELNTAVALDGTTLNVTDAGGDKGVDLDTTFA